MKNYRLISPRSINLFLLFVLTVGCQQEDTILPSTIIENMPGNEVLDPTEDFWVDEEYLKITGMTVEELLQEMTAEDAMEGSGEVLNGYLSSAKASNPFTETYKREILEDILNNPQDWFRAEISGEKKLGLGLGVEKLKFALKKLPKITEDRNSRKKRRRLDAYDFRLNKIYPSGSNGFKVIVKAKGKYRYYRRIFGKKRKVLQIRGTTTFSFKIRFDKASEKVILERFTAEGFKMKGLGGAVANIVLNLVEAFKGKLYTFDLRQAYDFPFYVKPYLVFTQAQIQTRNNKDYMIFFWNITLGANLEELTQELEEYNIDAF